MPFTEKSPKIRNENALSIIIIIISEPTQQEKSLDTITLDVMDVVVNDISIVSVCQDI